MPKSNHVALYAGSEVIEFSPTRALQQTLEVVEKNMGAMPEGPK